MFIEPEKVSHVESGLIAITTKFHGPTDTKPSRFSAVCGNCDKGGHTYVSKDHGLSEVQEHARAALAHLEKYHKFQLSNDSEPVCHHTIGVGHGTREGYVFPLVRIPEE